MKKYLLIVPGLLLSTVVFSQEMNSKKQQPIVSTETNTEKTEQTEKTVIVGSEKQVKVTETPVENQGKKEEENTPAATESSSKKTPK